MSHYNSSDPYSRLLMDRIIVLDKVVETSSASIICAQMLALASESDQDIHLYINTPGGSVTDAFMIIDIINFIKCKVCTVAIGCAASAGALILCSGTGKRIAFPHARIMVHQPLAQYSFKQIRDLEIRLKESLTIEEMIYDIFFQKCKHSDLINSVDDIRRIMDRDFFMSPEQAIQYGIIDQIAGK